MWPLNYKPDLRVLALLLFIGILAVILRAFLDFRHFSNFGYILVYRTVLLPHCSTPNIKYFYGV